MSLVLGLLGSIVRVDGEALVLHGGEKPYVVTPTEQIELATRPLSLDAVVGLVNQLLPAEMQQALVEFGAIQYELPQSEAFPGEHFTVIAAKGGDDLWTEVRRRRAVVEVPAPPPPPIAQPEEPPEPEPVVEVSTDAPTITLAAPVPSAPAREVAPPPDVRPPARDVPPPQRRETAPPPEAPAPPRDIPAPSREMPAAAREVFRPAREVEAPWVDVLPSREIAPPPPPREIARPIERPAPAFEEPPAPQPAVVLPMSRSPIRAEPPPPSAIPPGMSGLDRLLRLSAARGGSALYLSSDSRPSLRVDGELQWLEGEPELGVSDVQSLLLTLMPERSHEALRAGAATEWVSDIEGVGRVRCMTFRDYRGPGGVFRLMLRRPVTVEQLGLPAQVQSLAIEPEGLVLVTGPRSSGKRTIMSALVDLMNRARRDHIITFEREILLVHEHGMSFVSQREVRGHDDEVLGAMRDALREDPDVLVIEHLRTGDLIDVALEAAASGRLVIGGFPADSAAGALDRILDLYEPGQRRRVQLSLARALRGVVVQVLLRKNGGGRLPAREVLLNTPAVSSAIVEGKTSQLPTAIEGARHAGMIPLNDSLIALVQNGSVDAREAYRHAPDRPAFVAALKRSGVDTSAIERLA